VARLPHREGRPPNLDALRRYQKALGLNPQEVAQAIDSVSPLAGTSSRLWPLSRRASLEASAAGVAQRRPQASSGRPPALRHLTKPAPAGDRDAYRREIRFRKSWLYALHLATPHKPTCLGYALYAALTADEEPEEAYIDKAEELGLLKWIIALEAAALDIGTKTN